jgi:hypothetical protein
MLMLTYPAFRSPAKRIGVNPETRRVRQESGFDQAKCGLPSISTTGADERDVAVVHGWLQDHGVDLILGGRCRFGRGWLV